MVNFNTPNAIIIYFPAYAGGKFLTSQLALSKDCVGMNKWATAADMQVDGYKYSTFYNYMAGADWPNFEQFIENDFHVSDRIQIELDTFTEFTAMRHFYKLFKNCAYYDFKLQSALLTLPSKDNMLGWRMYEPDHNTFFGVSDGHYQTLSRDQLPFNDLAEFVSNSDRRFTMIAHEYSLLEDYLKVWPNATVIEFVNYRKFQELARSLKGPFNHAPKIQPADIGREIIHFDVDSAYYDKDVFLPATEKLYQQLGLPDFNATLVEQFYLAYANLHGLV